LLTIGKLYLAPPNSPPPPEFIGVAASRTYHGAPAHQPDLKIHVATPKSDGGAAEESSER